MARSTSCSIGEGATMRLPDFVTLHGDNQNGRPAPANAQLIGPHTLHWNSLFDNGPKVTDDFMIEFIPLTAEEREKF